MSTPVAAARRLVVKVGSSLVTNDGRGLDHAAVARWAAQIAELKRAGKEVVLVSSGAIAEGIKRLGWSARPSAMHELQAAAAVGQMGLVQAYESAFAEVRAAHRADPAHARRPRRPPPLPQRALDAAHAARARRDPDHQRERHGDDRRDPLRRQRHAGRAGDESDRSRRARAAHRPAGALHGRSAPRPAGDARARRARRRPAARGNGRRRGQRARPRRHADQGARGEARGALRRVDGDRERPRGATC